MKNIKYKIFILILLFFTINIIGQNKNQTFCFTPPISENEELFSYKMKNTKALDSYCLKIYVHVIRRSNGTGGQSIADVNEALNYLDADFNPHGIYFEWDGKIDYIDNNSYYSSASSVIFNINNHSDGIDIYLYDDGSSAGGRANGVGDSSEFYVSGNLFNTNLVKSSVISHEMGHVLFLWHTHHGCETGNWEPTNGANCSTTGDFVCDTPSDPHISFNVDSNCNWTGATNCSPPEPITSYNPDEKIIMSYTRPNCMEYFTEGQGQRMRNAIATLPHLINSTITCDNCEQNLTITQNVNSGQTDIHESSNTITATNTIFSGATAEYDAGTTVYLKSNFHAKSGSSFRAYIKGCKNAISKSKNKTYLNEDRTINDVEEYIKIYPNPTKNKLTIESRKEVSNWLIISPYGKSYFTGDTTKTIDMNKLPNGIYFLKAILKDGKIVMKKIIKN